MDVLEQYHITAEDKKGAMMRTRQYEQLWLETLKDQGVNLVNMARAYGVDREKQRIAQEKWNKEHRQELAAKQREYRARKKARTELIVRAEAV